MNKNFEQFYETPIKESKKWRNKFKKLIEQGKVDELFDFVEETSQKPYLKQYQIVDYIDEFTSKTTTKEKKQEMLEYLVKYNDYVKGVKIHNGVLKIDTIDGKILVYPLSSFYPILKNDKPDIETMERKHLCHFKTPEIALQLDIPNDIVTGYIYGLSDKDKYLHTWIEGNISGSQIVIDYTMNLVINKNGYYLLKHPEPISRIPRQLLKKDLNKLISLDEISVIEWMDYLVFRDEIMRDLDKNKQLFNEER